jgi:chromosome partitioning protein
MSSLDRPALFVDSCAAMRTIVIASRKGGAGKTTICTLLAVEAERAGAGAVAMVDLDPMRGLTQWWEARKADAPALVASDGGAVAAFAAAKVSGAALVLVDTPPATAPGMADVVALADLLLIPVQPSPHDLRAVGATVEIARQAHRPVVFVINRTKPRVKLTGQAAIALSQHGTVAPAMIADRSVYAAAAIDGRTAPEIEPDGAAAAEIADLWRYVADRLKEPTR